MIPKYLNKSVIWFGSPAMDVKMNHADMRLFYIILCMCILMVNMPVFFPHVFIFVNVFLSVVLYVCLCTLCLLGCPWTCCVAEYVSGVPLSASGQ